MGDLSAFVRETAGRFSTTDILAALLAAVALWGIRKAPKGRFFDDPLNRAQGLALRGLFACVVVFCHVSDRLLSEGGFLFPRFELWSALAVSVFFGLSGYGLMRQTAVDSGYLDGFWKKRLRALRWPYLAVSLLAFVQWCRGDYAMGPRLEKWLGLVDYGWYFTVLLLFYLAFWFGNRRRERELGHRLALTVGGVLLVTVLLAFAGFRRMHFESNGAFVAGLFFGAYRDEGCKFLRVHWGKAVAVACAIAAIRLSWGLSRWAMAGVRADSFFFLHVFWVAGLAALSMKWQLGNPVLSWLGTISYELYLVHGWVIDEIAHWRPEWKGAGCAWTVVLASLLLAWVLHKAVEACKSRVHSPSL